MDFLDRPIYEDRTHAGQTLAALLASQEGMHGDVILGLPRGGVPVAAEIARELSAPLDVLVVRKLGMPGQPELAMGAVASGGVTVLNEDVLASRQVSEHELADITVHELAEVDRREREYRGDRPPVDVAGRATILVDDGLATGASASAAIRALRSREPESITFAVPVAPPEALAVLQPLTDKIICPLIPTHFLAVSRHYADFSPVTDDEVRQLLIQFWAE